MTRKETTIEQSERLIQSGANPSTADKYYEDYDAWSLAAVIDLLPRYVNQNVIKISHRAGNWFVTYDNILGGSSADLLEACVRMHEYLYK